MNFDEELKRRARAHDAVDKLRELKCELERMQSDAASRSDLKRRGVILIVLASIVLFAVDRI